MTSKRPGLSLNFSEVATKPVLEAKEREKSSFEIERESKSARGSGDAYIGPKLQMDVDKERLEELRINSVGSRPVSARTTSLGTIRDTEQAAPTTKTSEGARMQRGRSKTARALGNSDNTAQKIGVVGYPGVGKSSLSGVLANGTFPEVVGYTQSSVLPVKRRGLFVNSPTLEIVDFSNGTEEKIVNEPKSSKYRNIPIYLCVYSVAIPESFETVKKLVEAIRKASSSIKILIVGTHSLTEPRLVSEDAVVEFAEQQQIPFVEVDSPEKVNYVELETLLFKQVNTVSVKQDKKSSRKEQAKEILPSLVSALETSALGLEIGSEPQYEFTSILSLETIDCSETEILCFRSFLLIRQGNNLESYSLENGVRAGLGLDELAPRFLRIHKKRLYFMNDGSVECWSLSLSSPQFTYTIEGGNVITYVTQYDKIYCGTDSGKVVSFNIDDATPTMIHDFSSPITALSVKDNLYVAAGGKVSQINLEDNSLIRESPVDFEVTDICSFNNLVYCRSVGNLLVLTPEGTVAESQELNVKIEKPQRLSAKLSNSRYYALMWVQENTIKGVFLPSD